MDKMTMNNSGTYATTLDPFTDVKIKLHNILAILAIFLWMLVTILGNAVGDGFFGNVLYNLWLTSDVLLCTASILCIRAIALDRYWAIHDPINYAQKRTVKRVLVTIAIVWVFSAIISVPPLLGWNDRGGSMSDSFTGRCALTGEKGYVAYSALGSFYIPFIIMSFVYLKIYLATNMRLRERAQNAKGKLAIVKNTSYPSVATAPNCIDEGESDEPSPMVNDPDTLSSPRSPLFIYQDQFKLRNNNCETLQQMQHFFRRKAKNFSLQGAKGNANTGNHNGCVCTVLAPFFPSLCYLTIL
ncbi:hypothetical protein CHS0354_041347 [Potamilus streckersoni]|uniref:G-protein coupled receptors family 1 profile domain-containing protein n=1 Tax=Potamilus streckersoni TaxID=2493646 RepID=A0AAE0SEM4_9BIVA|nr:hypothetical protein CHS0354_041347 [Potamilus streckersoni]